MPVTVSDLLAIAVLAFVGVRLGEAARASTRRGSRSWELVRGLRPRHFGWAVPIVVAVLTLAVGLSFVPGLSFGGWRATGTRDGALLESSRAHLAYNLVIVGLVELSLLTELALGP